MLKVNRHKIKSVFLSVLTFSICLIDNLTVYAQQDNGLIAKIDSSLEYLISLQLEIKDIHPFLKEFNPIVIYDKDSLFIFDIIAVNKRYEFPMPRKVKASFPLQAYFNKPACIVTKDIFDSLDGYITVFHEFIHCRQFLTVEQKVKNKLKINQIAVKKKDYSWEITHPFPYGDTTFVDNYSAFIKAADTNDSSSVLNFRAALERHLKLIDYEYMVWVEWKEGFARLVENKIREKYGLKYNEFGNEIPYNRISFYYGGEKFIAFLIKIHPELYTQVDSLFYKMYNPFNKE
jgi:hypothetical protein